jgi:ABC-2 type transport system permease protein
MSSLYVSMANEIQKVFLRKKNIVLLVIAASIPVAAAFSFGFLQDRLGIFAVNGASFPIFVLDILTSVILPLFIFSVAADLFAGEVGENTLKITLTRPVTRLKVFLSKIAATGAFIVACLGVVFVIAIAAGAVLAGSAPGPAGIGGTLLAYSAAVVPMLVLAMLAAFLNQLFKSGSSALMASVLVYLLAKAMPFVSPAIGRLSPVAHTGWHSLLLGTTVGAGVIWNALLLMAAYLLIFFGGGYYLFDKKDF